MSDRSLTKDMHVRLVKMIVFAGEDCGVVVARDERTLVFDFRHLGDHDECWIRQLENGVEVARHNCRYLVTIEWADPKETP